MLSSFIFSKKAGKKKKNSHSSQQEREATDEGRYVPSTAAAEHSFHHNSFDKLIISYSPSRQKLFIFYFI